MKPVRAGRFAAVPTGEVTVFLTGMRINKWWRVGQWLPVLLAMPRMLNHLANHPESGFLGQEAWYGRTTILISYWRSPEDLFAFALDNDAPHRSRWTLFRRRTGDNGAVGIWNETYTTGDREAIYANMPEFGLGKAIGTVPVDDSMASARSRIRAWRPDPS